MKVFAPTIALILAFPAAQAADTSWQTFTSRDGNFLVDFPGRPNSSTKTAGSRREKVKIVVTQCKTPDAVYVVEKLSVAGGGGGTMKSAEIDSILDEWRDDIAREFKGKVTNQKNLRLETGAHGRDFTIEGRPDPKVGLMTVRVREFLSNRELYLLIAAAPPDRDLPEDAGRFFGSFTIGTRRLRKVGPDPEPEGSPLGDWGLAIDPDKDCRIDDQGKALAITVPETHHDLNADTDKMNAPRVMREVSGDFTMTVRVNGGFKPTAKSTNPRAVPYEGAGILVWQDSDNYIFLGRAAMSRSGKTNEMAAFEEREWGARAALNNKPLPPGPFFVRIERKGNRILGSVSKDGRDWMRLDPMETSYPSTIKVGLYAINGCTEPFTAKFEDFKFSEGTSKAPSKKKR